MRNRWAYFRPLLDYLGLLAWATGLLLLAPLAAQILLAGREQPRVGVEVFLLPAGVSLALGLALNRNLRFPPLDGRRAMVLCAGLAAGLGHRGMPLWLGLNVGLLDAYFESVSGFTTTAMTVLAGLDDLPAGILFWRASWSGWAGWGF